MKLIDKDALVAEIERMIKHYNESAKEFGDEGYNDNVLMEQSKANACKYILSFLDTIEVKLEVKEVDLEEIIKSHFDIKNINDVKITTTGGNLLNLVMRINKFVMDTTFRQYRQIGENTGDESLDEEIEKIIKMNDMWGGLMPNTLIKYTAKHFFELGLRAQKGE